MNRQDLEHIIRAAADVTNEDEFIIVGSQSILGPIPYPPEIFKMSAEADIYPRDAEEKSTLIDGVIGEGSPFHTTYGYYAQGVDSRTAKLPQGWEDRVFNMALLQYGYVVPAAAIQMVEAMHLLSDADKKSMRARIRRWVKMLQDQGYAIPSA